jgi:glutathionylspermidine synthase
MVPSARAAFNARFTDEKYQSLLKDIQQGLLKPVEFRIAETPIFIGAAFRDMLIEAGNDIIETILRPDFKQITERAIPQNWNVSNENDHPHFIALDFGVCSDEDGKLMPKLIEMQGFPSLYGFQAHQAHHYQQAYGMPDDANWSIYFNGLNDQTYIELLKKTILGPYQPDEVVLMDVNAYNQKTAVDFFITQSYLGIPIVALEELKQVGNQLFYELDGELKPIKRIYNRLIFDEIENNHELLAKVIDVRQPLNVEWITHPNWFYRISKYTMPFLKGDYIPETFFLNELETIPPDLENYVLKPLFSFAGQGVIIDVKQSDIEAIGDRQNWILQQKVNYEPAIQAPDGGVKAEIRLLYLWPDGHERPTLAINLSRLSRGKMIGVRYNQNFDWVGGTVAFMEK